MQSSGGGTEGGFDGGVDADPCDDPGREPVEWVDEQGDVTEVVTRARMRRENLRHRSAAVVVVSTDGKRLLIHQRSMSKDLRPGWWDVCAGGVLGVGEPALDGARRELAEELGVHGVDLVELGSGRFDAADSRELSTIYLARYDGPFRFADGEVARAEFVTRAVLRERMRIDQFLPTCEALILPLVPGFG